MSYHISHHGRLAKKGTRAFRTVTGVVWMLEMRHLLDNSELFAGRLESFNLTP